MRRSLTLPRPPLLHCHVFDFSFYLKERCNEEIPDPATPSPAPMLNYSVYTDMKLVETHLTLPSFHCVPSRKGADILWLGDHFKNFR